ncbi:MAG: dicarboxylate/amino acid:cation symporter [Halobacteriovoraceae bacterium]|nr:dicarboxylate/amino acid:cation symporter [Halobacteriovoraceae bacterium]
MKKITHNLTFWVISFGILGYLSANLFGEKVWATSNNPPEIYGVILMVKTLFINMLKMLVAPIVFFSLVGGLINIGNVNTLKSLGKIAITYYISTTIIAIAIGLVAVFFIHPWEGSKLKNNGDKNVIISPKMQVLESSKFIDVNSNSASKIIGKILEKTFVNPFEALSERNILGIAFNAFLIGLGILLGVPGNSPLTTAITHINLALNKILSWFILFSPLGIFAIVFDFKLKMSGNIFTELLSFAVLVLGATLFHGVIVLPFIAKIYTGISPVELFKKIGKPLAIAFSTSSSSATLPVTMKTCENELGINPGVSGFVFPLGATMNMDGTALFEGVAAIFLANLYGIELTTVSILSIFFMAMISSIGAPGMPSGSMSGMQMVLLAAGIPLEAIGLLMIVEKPLDTFRTAVNVEGDIIGALIVQKSIDKNKKE